MKYRPYIIGLYNVDLVRNDKFTLPYPGPQGPKWTHHNIHTQIKHKSDVIECPRLKTQRIKLKAGLSFKTKSWVQIPSGPLSTSYQRVCLAGL